MRVGDVVTKIIGLGLVLCALGIVLAVRTGAIQIPDRFNPWANLSLDEKPNFLTRFKLARLSKDPALCRGVLMSSGFEYAMLEDRITGYACGFHNAVRIEKTSAAVGESFSLSCRAAVSLAMWERHVLQPTALKYFRQRVERLEHFGSYACRNVYGRPQATRSRHATAEAFDLAGFVLTDGQRIRVVSDWASNGVEGQFLRELRTGACAFFDGVLSPDYNEAHRDHLHLDRGPYRVCQ
jgi:hypothetical protein